MNFGNFCLCDSYRRFTRCGKPPKKTTFTFNSHQVRGKRKTCPYDCLLWSHKVWNLNQNSSADEKFSTGSNTWPTWMRDFRFCPCGIQQVSCLMISTISICMVLNAIQKKGAMWDWLLFHNKMRNLVPSLIVPRQMHVGLYLMLRLLAKVVASPRMSSFCSSWGPWANSGSLRKLSTMSSVSTGAPWRSRRVAYPTFGTLVLFLSVCLFSTPEAELARIRKQRCLPGRASRCSWRYPTCCLKLSFCVTSSDSSHANASEIALVLSVLTQLSGRQLFKDVLAVLWVPTCAALCTGHVILRSIIMVVHVADSWKMRWFLLSHPCTFTLFETQWLESTILNVFQSWTLNRKFDPSHETRISVLLLIFSSVIHGQRNQRLDSVSCLSIHLWNLPAHSKKISGQLWATMRCTFL